METHLCVVRWAVGIDDETIDTRRNRETKNIRVSSQCEIAEIMLTTLLADVESNTRAVATIYRKSNAFTLSTPRFLLDICFGLS